jgi:DNA helicase-2/ATP-dependent DNA helicase PcrA
MASFDTPQASAADWQALVSLFRLLRQENSTWPAEMDLVARWYAPYLQRIYEDAQVRQGDLVQLQQIASTYPSRERFLTELTLDPPSATSAEAAAPGLDDDYLILSTIHSAKGQEWKTVHVLNVIDGCIPSDMSTGTSEEIEEERRLLYVAMTRAKDHLHLMVPQRFYVHQQATHGDRHVYASRSRFIPDTVIQFFDSCAWPMAAPACGVEEPPATHLSRHIDVAARVRASWR